MKKLFYSMLCLFSVLMAGTKLKAQPVITTQPVAAAEFTPNGESNPTSYTNQSCLYLGNTADLSVVATGALTYQWTLNGTPITDATGTNYSLDDIQATQAGEYACVVSNSGGGVTSSVVTVQPWAQMYWGPVTALSDDSVLTQPGTVLEADAFGGTGYTVTVSGTGQVIDFKGASASVATVNQSGQYNAFAGTITGNAQFDLVLDEGSYDGPITVDGNPCKIITFKDLTPGSSYSVLLIGLDDRSCCDTRVVWFEDAADMGNQTTNFMMGANDYLVGSFIAGGTTETVNEVVESGSGNIQCLVVYALTNAPQFPGPLAAYPADTNFSGVTVTLAPGSLVGQLPFTYQWQSVTATATNNILNATNNTLTLPDTTTNNSGNYQLVAINSSGMSTSAPIALTIAPASPPLFTTNVTQPPTLFLNDQLTLVSGVAGSPPIYLQWQLNGSDVPGATNVILTFNALQASQSGIYTLIASNQFKAVTNNPVTLTVNPFTQFNWFPVARITTADATLDQIGTNVFGATDFGGVGQEVTLDDGTNIVFTGDTSVASVTGAGTFEGAYTATTGNSDFDAVLDGANYDDGPKTITIYNLIPGTQYAVQLFALDDRAEYNVRPIYFQDPLDTNNVSETFIEGSNDYVMGTFVANGTNQTITEQTPGILGNANAGAGSGNLNALVLYSLARGATVWDAPTASPADTNFSGVIVTLSDPAVTGIGPIYYQWQFGATNLQNATNTTLVLTNTTTTDSGNYRLVVSNSSGMSTSAPVALTIEPSSAPQFGAITPPPTLFLNDKVTLVASVAGTPPIYLQWQLNGSNILGATNATLTLSGLQASQSGAYTLVASNFLKAVTNTPTTVTVEPFPQFAWSPPGPITTADEVLGQIGTVFGAVDFDNVDITVTLDDGTNIDFTGDTSVASVTGSGTYNDFLNGIALTTNANFNAVLTGGNYDSGPKTITLYNLTPGNLYAVQLFALEDRWQDYNTLDTLPIPERRIYFQDPNNTNDVSQSYTEGDNYYLLGTFLANGTNQVITEETPGIPGNGDVGSGNANALVVYSLPQGANAWIAPTASPASTVPVGTTVTLSDTAVTGIPPISYQWQTNGVNIPGATDSELVLTDVLAAQPGKYALVVSNIHGTNTSPPLALNIVNEPVFTTNGAGWTANGGPGFADGLLTLTTNTDQETSFFFDTPMYIGAFQASFTYQATGTAPLADGITFCLQNSPDGAAVVGGGGGELGFGGITNSAAIDFNINDANTNGYAFTVNGQMTANGPASGYTAPGSVNLGSGDPINVGITYNGSKITLTLVDSLASASYTNTMTVGPLWIPSVLGADTAYVGFTGGTGGEGSTQTVTNFTFTPLASLSAGLSLTNNMIVISWPTGIGGFVLQTTTNLAESWTTVPPPYATINGELVVTIPTTAGAFYRLQLSQ